MLQFLSSATSAFLETKAAIHSLKFVSIIEANKFEVVF